MTMQERLAQLAASENTNDRLEAAYIMGEQAGREQSGLSPDQLDRLIRIVGKELAGLFANMMTDGSYTHDYYATEKLMDKLKMMAGQGGTV